MLPIILSQSLSLTHSHSLSLAETPFELRATIVRDTLPDEALLQQVAALKSKYHRNYLQYEWPAKSVRCERLLTMSFLS